MRTAISSLTLLRPRTLTEALRMLRDVPTLMPVAGCTDLYVNLQFGTTRETTYIDLWPLDDLRVASSAPARSHARRGRA
jgi:CO/xanthine dehydrogenase FAD-binding subunit